MKKYYVEKSNIDEQPKKDGAYFTTYGRLRFAAGVPGTWYNMNGMPCDSPPWYLEEVACSVIVLDKSIENNFMEAWYDRSFESPTNVLEWFKRER